MDTEEMYRRGYADAERGEPNPFYYQHYYHYRRGFDHGRRGLGLPLPGRRRIPWRGILLLLIAAAAAVVVAQYLRQPTAPVAAPATSQPVVVSTTRPATATPRPTEIPNTPTPTQVSITLRVGGKAVVANIAGNTLRARRQPSLKSPVQAGFRTGQQVTILEGPVEADGYTWWRVENANGSGWSAQGSPEGVVWLVPSE